jgi:hypothetical protein
MPELLRSLVVVFKANRLIFEVLFELVGFSAQLD